MINYLSKSANESFKKAKYHQAIELYQKLADLIGYNSVKNNIALCQNKIKKLESDNKIDLNFKRRACSNNNYKKEDCKYENEINVYKDYPVVKKDCLLNLAKSLPVSNGSAYFKKFNISVAVITDIFMYNVYKDSFVNFVYITPNNYEDKFKKYNFDILLFITCWEGLSGEWIGMANLKNNKIKTILEKIVNVAKQKNIKTVFQSIEDPSNYEYFVDIAKNFEYIFTSDINSIKRYIKDCSNENVFYGEYGINPLLHNPIGCRKNIINSCFFAGSYVERYIQRCKDMESMFSSIIHSKGNLIIADRNYGLSKPFLYYPKEYEKLLIPSVEHTILQSMHKLFRYNLNFNSIINSPTMCAMRVYELQDMGVGIFSNFALSTYINFPEIRIIPCSEDLTLDFNNKMNFFEYKQSMACVRNMYSENTIYDRIEEIFKTIGINKFQNSNPCICVIIDEHKFNIFPMLSNQIYNNFILIEEKDIDTYEKWKRVEKKYNIKYFTWLNSKYEYENYYLLDMLNAFKYTNCDYITKDSWFEDDFFHNGIQHDYTATMPAKCRTLFSSKKYAPIDFKDLDLQQSINLPNGYAIDPFELNFSRFCESNNFMSREQSELSIIIPVYNNGKFLEYKTINSLRHNKIWPKIDVIIADQGSTDADTIYRLKRLTRENSNIHTFVYDLRENCTDFLNQAIKKASSTLVAFLETGNEMTPGGYDTLIQLYKKISNEQDQPIEFLSGYTIQIGRTKQIVSKYFNNEVLILDHEELFEFMTKNKPIISYEACIFSKDLLLKNFLYPDYIFGFNEIFTFYLLTTSGLGAFTSKAYNIAYEGISNRSLPNFTTDLKKSLLSEIALADLLNKDGLLELFNKYYYDRYMNNKYLCYFNEIKDEDKPLCFDLICKIAKYYTPHTVN